MCTPYPRPRCPQARMHTYPPYPCCPDESDWPVMIVEVALERQNL